MPCDVYRYVFEHEVPFEEVLAVLDLSVTAVECLHGESRARLDARFADDAEKHAVVIDASTDVGQALNQLFVGYSRREIGESTFRVDRTDRLPEGSNAAGASG